MPAVRRYRGVDGAARDEALLLDEHAPVLRTLRIAWSCVLWCLLLFPLLALPAAWRLYLAGLGGRTRHLLLWTTALLVSLVATRIIRAFIWGKLLLSWLHEHTHMIFALLNLCGVIRLRIEVGEGEVATLRAPPLAKAMISLSPYFFSPLYLALLLKPWMSGFALKMLVVMAGAGAGMIISTAACRETWRQPDLMVLPRSLSAAVIAAANISSWVVAVYVLSYARLDGLGLIYRSIPRSLRTWWF